MKTHCLVAQDIESPAWGIDVLYVPPAQTAASLLLCISSLPSCILSDQIQFNGMAEKDRWASKGYIEIEVTLIR
jgi:hypothetical protein